MHLLQNLYSRVTDSSYCQFQDSRQQVPLPHVDKWTVLAAGCTLTGTELVRAQKQLRNTARSLHLAEKVRDHRAARPVSANPFQVGAAAMGSMCPRNTPSKYLL